MYEQVKISPSILSANFINLGEDLCMMEQAGADWVHVDVMDGHFVPNLTMGIPVAKQLKKATSLPLDVHLMIDNPLVQIPWFLDAGSDIITFHREAVSDDEVTAALDMIHGAGVKAALALKPKTPVETLEPYIEDLDMVLVMSVEPGFSGQSYIEGTEDKIRAVVEMARAHGCSPLIQVDGGIGNKTYARVVEAGADVLVCGNAIFAADDPAYALAHIKHSAHNVQNNKHSCES